MPFALPLLGSWELAVAEALIAGRAPLTLAEHLLAAQFWFESLQNWQGEFLSVLALAVLSIWLPQEHSPSKPVAAPHGQTGPDWCSSRAQPAQATYATAAVWTPGYRDGSGGTLGIGHHRYDESFDFPRGTQLGFEQLIAIARSRRRSARTSPVNCVRIQEWPWVSSRELIRLPDSVGQTSCGGTRRHDLPGRALCCRAVFRGGG